MSGAGQAASRLRAALEGAGRSAPPPVVRVITKTTAGLQEVEPFDRGMTLAAQAFTSLFPLIIASAALVPRGTVSLADYLSDTLQLPESSRTLLEQALPAQPDTRGTFGVLSVLVVVVSATSFSRALARMYAKVWRVRPSGWSGGWRWVACVLGVALAVVIMRALRALSRGTVYGTVGEMLATLALNALLWTWVPWLLLRRQITWRRLLPGGVIMAACSVVTSIASGLYLPRALVSAARQFGALGVAFTYIGWLFVVAFVLICSTVLGAVLARDESRLARRIVGAERDPGPAPATGENTTVGAASSEANRHSPDHDPTRT
jgi:membrane protein